jgi:hypothetical protein
MINAVDDFSLSDKTSASWPIVLQGSEKVKVWGFGPGFETALRDI